MTQNKVIGKKMTVQNDRRLRKSLYLSRSGECKLASGLKQLVLALLALSREGCRSLVPVHCIQGGGERQRKQREEDQLERKASSPVPFTQSAESLRVGS